MLTPKLESLIWEGKARYETRAFAIQAYNLIEVPANEFIIITGYDFQPAQIVIDTVDANEGYQGLHRIEFLSAGNYNAYYHKMSGNTVFLAQNATAEQRVSQKPFHHINGLYMVCKKDIGIALSVMPDITALNPGAFNTPLTNNLFNQLGNQQGDFQQYAGLPGGNSALNNSNYSEAYAAGRIDGLQSNNFTFRDNAPIHRYKRFGTDVYTKEETNMWTLVVHFVRIFENPKTIS